MVGDEESSGLKVVLAKINNKRGKVLVVFVTIDEVTNCQSLVGRGEGRLAGYCKGIILRIGARIFCEVY